MFSYKNASRTLSMNKSTLPEGVGISGRDLWEGNRKQSATSDTKHFLPITTCPTRWMESMLFCSLQQSFTYLKTYDALGRLRREFKFFQPLLKTLISRLLIVLKSLTWECPTRLLQSSFFSLGSLWALVPRYIVTPFQLLHHLQI